MRSQISAGFPARPRGGVTLLELLLAVAALTLLVTVALPWAGRAMIGLRAARAADTVADALTEARRLAMVDRRVVRVLVDETGASLDVEGGDIRRLPPGVRLSGPPAGEDGLGRIVFYPDGSSDGGQLVVATADIAWALSVEPRDGRIRRVYAGRS